MFSHFFRTLSKKHPAGLSQLHSTCPQEHFRVKKISTAIIVTPNRQISGEKKLHTERVLFVIYITTLNNKTICHYFGNSAWRQCHTINISFMTCQFFQRLKLHSPTGCSTCLKSIHKLSKILNSANRKYFW